MKKEKKDIFISPIVGLRSWNCRYCFEKVKYKQNVCKCCGYGVNWYITSHFGNSAT